MNEIEVKARITNHDLLISKLAEKDIVFSEPITQKDIVYVYGDWEVTRHDNQRNIFRLRWEDHRTLLTLKRPGVNELDSLEEETEVSNPDSVVRMLELLNYHEFVRVNKLRRRATYGNFELCLDIVEELGAFIEVEVLLEKGNTEVIQENLFQFLEMLGVSRGERITQGYDTLILLKKNKKA